MAFRKETIRQQFSEAIVSVLEPGERVTAGAYTVSGPSPWLTGLLGVVIMLLAGMRYYFVAVTDRRVILMKASMWSQRPRGVASAYPTSSVSLSDVTMAGMWSHLRFQPAGGKRIRLNFHKFWRGEMQQVVAAIQAGAATGPTGTALPPPPPPTPPPPPPQA